MMDIRGWNFTNIDTGEPCQVWMEATVVLELKKYSNGQTQNKCDRGVPPPSSLPL